jgi:phosphoribosylformylglycinamidine synthase
VAEAARKVACTGAIPVAATNCLNFGNPEKPEIMAQFSATVDGIAEACTALGTPITGGNVSFYNETRGEGIYPTPVVGVVGLLEDVSKAVPSGFQQAGDLILVVTASTGPNLHEDEQEFGSSEYAKTILGFLWGIPPRFEPWDHTALQNLLIAMSEQSLITSASDISDGGLAVAFARACIPNQVGASIDLPERWTYEAEHLFRETGAVAIITCAPEYLTQIEVLAKEVGPDVTVVGQTGGCDLSIRLYDKVQIASPVSDLYAAYASTLESQLAAEVVTA